MPYPNSSLANSTPLYGLRILLAEDHVFNQEVITDILNIAGAAVCLAQNGQEALDLLRQAPFDCLLLDIQMPVMDGFQTIAQIRADPMLANMAVIAMTANASEEERCRSAGMDDFIEKPFEPARLHRMIAGLSPITAAHALAPKKAIDLSVLANWIGDDPLKLRTFAEKFLNSARQDLIEIDAALHNEDFPALATLAHHLSSPARMVGASPFFDLCRGLEKNSLTTRDITIAHNLIRQMHDALDHITQIIRQELA
jgi:CheY-like chemotaxis protein